MILDLPDPRPELDADVGLDADPDGLSEVDGLDGTGDAGDDGLDSEHESDVDPCARSTCGVEELCGEGGTGDGLDNDCDDDVDETCECPGIGVARTCFPGDPFICAPAQPCAGVCVRGVQECEPSGVWGPCRDAVTPTTETCNAVDDDCDGVADEGLASCTPALNCPGTTRIAPMSWVSLDGSSIYSGTVESFAWDVFCPATIPPSLCPAPEEAVAPDTRVYIVASGTYRARTTIRASGDLHVCEFALIAESSGLRVELTWDTQGAGFGDTDLDLHLHRPGPETAFFSADDCCYSNCKGSTYSDAVSAAWDLAPTDDLLACRDAPHGEGALWVATGSCYNPRLDIDVVYCAREITDPANASYCAPENINVDNPPSGEPLRIMVNYYSAHSFRSTTQALVNVYCGGSLRAAFGPAPLRNGASYGSSNDSWYVADVQFATGPCGVYDCRIVPLFTSEGDYVIETGGGFGPAWSRF